MAESVLEQFVGAWKLVRTEFRRSDGQVIYPYGRDVQGIIIYDHSGYMSVHIVQKDRPAFASKDAQRGTLDEIAAAFKGYLGYYGTFDVNEEEMSVTHHIISAWFPNWAGGDQKRFYEFSQDPLSGKRLTLKTPPQIIDGSEATGMLVWESVAGHQPE